MCVSIDHGYLPSRNDRGAPAFAQRIQDSGLARPVLLPRVVPKRDTRLRPTFPQVFSNTFSSSQLCGEPKVVRALLGQTAVDSLLELRAEVA